MSSNDQFFLRSNIQVEQRNAFMRRFDQDLSFAEEAFGFYPSLATYLD